MSRLLMRMIIESAVPRCSLDRSKIRTHALLNSPVLQRIRERSEVQLFPLDFIVPKEVVFFIGSELPLANGVKSVIR